MRSRTLLAVVFAVSSFVLPVVAHAAIPFFGPIIPQTGGQASCPASWGMLITVINNVIELLLTLAIVFVAPLMIAYSGFLFVVNPVNASGKEQAKKILTNTVVGIVIALAGWLIVDAIMAALYNPGASSGTTTLGRWSDIITSGGVLPCIPLAGSLNQAVPSAGVTTGIPQVGKARGLCADSNTACGIPAIQQAAQALSMNLSTAQVTTMSCIAVTESGGVSGGPYSNTGACGTFQITTQPGNWSNTNLHRSPCTTSVPLCNNAACNLQTALLLYNQNGYQPWTGKKPDGMYWNANAVACAQKYDPGARI